MNIRVQDPSSDPDMENSADPKSAEPGWQEWALLLADTTLNFLRLLLAETTLAFALLPSLLLLNMFRIPMLILTWLSFSLLASCVMYAFTGMLVAAAATVFVLQLLGTLLLESVLRKVRRQASLPESRKNASIVAASINERFGPGHFTGPLDKGAR